MVMQRNESRTIFDTKCPEELLRGAGIFAGDNGDRAQHLHETARHVAKIANGSCSENDHASSLALPSLAMIST